MKQLHLINNAHGLGDALTCLWVMQALVDDGFEVFFYTFHDYDVSCFAQPNLTVLPINTSPENGLMVYGKNNEWWLTVGGSRHELIAKRVSDYLLIQGVTWAPRCERPRSQPLNAESSLIKPNETIALFPHSFFGQREWCFTHWLRLTEKLQARGEHVVVVALKDVSGDFGCPCLRVPTRALYALLPQVKAIICIDSGGVHFGALSGRPTFCVHAMSQRDALCKPYDNVVSIMPMGDCVGCHALTERGYSHRSCGHSCSQLQTVSPEQVLNTYETTFKS